MEYTKQEKEAYLAKEFLKYYNSSFNTSISFIRNGEQWKINEPDIICNHNFFIEIVKSEYWEKIVEAQKFIEKWKGNKTRDLIKDGYEVKRIQTLNWRSLDITSLQGVDDKAFCVLQKTIYKKFFKKYDWIWINSKFILLVWIDTPITTSNDFKDHLLKCPIIIESNDIYDEIWCIIFQERFIEKVQISDFLDIWNNDVTVFRIASK